MKTVFHRILAIAGTGLLLAVDASPAHTQCIRAMVDQHWRDSAVAIFRGTVLGDDTLSVSGRRAQIRVRVTVDTVWRFPQPALGRAVPWFGPGVVGLSDTEIGEIDSCEPGPIVGEQVLVYAFRVDSTHWTSHAGLTMFYLRWGLDERDRLGPGRVRTP